MMSEMGGSGGPAASMNMTGNMANMGNMQGMAGMDPSTMNGMVNQAPGCKTVCRA